MLMKIRKRILVADDHAGMQQRVSNLLESQFEVVAIVNDGLAAIEATARLKPDLVLLDVLMPQMDGIRAAQELKRKGCKAKVVFLSVQQDAEYVDAAFESGAMGYVFKSRMHSDLVWALDRALAGEVFVSPGAKDRGNKEMSGGVSFDVDRFQRFQLDSLDIPSEAEFGQCEDAVPIHIDFIPLESMARGLGRVVVVVVPAFAKREKRNPETVGGQVAGFEALLAPHMRGGVHQPGEVQAEHRTEK